METTQLQVSASVKSTNTPDGVVLLDVQGGMCFPLDAVGTIIWKGLEQHASVEAIAQQVAATYQIPMEQALADTREFVQQLQAQHLVRDGSEKERADTGGWISMLGRSWRRNGRRKAKGVESDQASQ